MIILLGSTGKLGTIIKEKLNESHTEWLPIDRHLLDNKEKLKQFLHSLNAPFVILDVSLPTATEKCAHFLTNLLKEKHDKIKLLGYIAGTTGHNSGQLKTLTQLSEYTAVSVVPNFSKGVFLLEKLLQEEWLNLAHNLGFDSALTEVHHKYKKDAPSGTARMLAERALISADKIHAVRVGHVVGEHTLVYSAPNEVIELSHRAFSRDVFALGALDIVKNLFIKKPKPGLYDKSFFWT